MLGGTPVEIPPGAFLQPSAEGERVIAALVAAAVGNAPSVVDLFAGCGTLTFPLARTAKVHAVEGEGAALSALKSAAEAARLPITTEARDLARRPLLPDELKRFAAAVFDPPRAGAPEQAAQLAQGGPPLVVAVSCHPVSFAHDARLLAEGGYELQAVTPIDQFPWSAHVEMVGVFKR
jgi:23S rRNA (uracil1939-C5)-methyltransferase